MDEIYKKTAANSLFTALLMLAVGFALFSPDPAYQPSVVLMTVMRVGGLAMLGVAVAAWRQSPFALRLDVVCSGLIGLSTAVIGIIWIVDHPRDLIAYVLLIFAVMCLRSARDSYRIDARLRTEAAGGFASQPAPPPAASSDPSPPADPQPPPPEGSLAELGRGKEPHEN